MDVGIYARKSTEQNGVADEAKSTSRQLEEARAFARARAWTVVDEFVDEGVSGALFEKRAEFQRMRRAAEAGRLNAVVLFDLDRFGRDGRKSMEALYRLADLEVEVWDCSTGRALDLDSFEGEMMTFFVTRAAEETRRKIRRHTRSSHKSKAEKGWVTGGLVFGYDNVRFEKGHVEYRINPEQAAIVCTIHERYAAGQGHRSIAKALNALGVPAPRAQQGRRSAWSATTVYAVLQRPLYRGDIVWGRTKAAWGRELGRRSEQEFAQVPTPEDTWVRVHNEALRIIDADLAARCDRRRENRRTRYLASLAKGGERVPERTHGKYLLTGGMLVCPCGGHFEAVFSPWKKKGVYRCSVQRRKPGICDNTLALPIAETDEVMLEMVAEEVLSPDTIEELLLTVDRGEGDDCGRIAADCDRLRKEVSRLVDSIAAGVPAETVASRIRDREAEIVKLEAQLRRPRTEPPNIDKLRAALQRRAEQWKQELRTEPKVARILLRRLIGPLTLWEEPRPEWCRWEAPSSAEGLLEGLVHLVASPAGVDETWTREVLAA